MNELEINDTNEFRITSLDLCDIINQARKEEGNRSMLRHEKMIRSIEEEIKILKKCGILGEPNFGLSSYKTSQNKDAKCYSLTFNGATEMLSKESALCRYKVVTKLEQLQKENKMLKENSNIPSYQIENPIERAKKWIEEETIRQQQQAQLTEQKPLVEFANHIGKASDCIDMNEFAKMLKKENIENMGRNRLFEWLRTHNILMSNNLPYQRYMEGGYFKVVETIKHTAYGDKLFSKCLVTGKGQIYLVEKIRENMEENNEI